MRIFITTILLCITTFVYAEDVKKNAAEAIVRAKSAIFDAEVLLASISPDSDEYQYLSELIKQASEDWEIALEAYNELEQASFELAATLDESLVNAFDKVITVNSQVASVHADAVVLSLSYVKLVADEKTAGLDRVRESINETSEIKELVLENKAYTDQTIINQFSDSDNDGFTDAVEIAAGTMLNNPTSYPTEELLEGIEDSESGDTLEMLEQAVESVVKVSENLAQLNVEMVVALTESDQDSLLAVEDLISDIDNVRTLQVGVQERFEELSQAVFDDDNDGFSNAVEESAGTDPYNEGNYPDDLDLEDNKNIQEELIYYLDMAADVSESILEGEEINVPEVELDEMTFEDIITAGEDLIDNVDNVEISIDGGINVWENIGQTETYQDVMNELVDIIQDASGNVLGGGETTGDSDATQY